MKKSRSSVMSIMINKSLWFFDEKRKEKKTQRGGCVNFAFLMAGSISSGYDFANSSSDSLKSTKSSFLMNFSDEISGACGIQLALFGALKSCPSFVARSRRSCSHLASEFSSSFSVLIVPVEDFEYSRNAHGVIAVISFKCSQAFDERDSNESNICSVPCIFATSLKMHYF